MLLIYKHGNGKEYVYARSIYDGIKFTMIFLLFPDFMKVISGFDTHDYKLVSFQTLFATFPANVILFSIFFSKFKMIIAPNVKLTVTQKLSHS